MTMPDMNFHANFDGEEEKTFYTLQSAMAWAEGLGHNQTGSISFGGQDIITYEDGNINAVQTG